MADHTEVFISGTTRDLSSYRREIKDALLTLRIFPIEESNFALAYGPLLAMLRDLIGRCDAVIHLAGLYYGAEPPQRPPGERRRSYTQIEYDVARELKKPLYLFLATENYEPDELCTQSDEEEELQLTHRRAIEQCGDIYYQFTGRGQLGIRIRELRFPARSTEAPRRVVRANLAELCNPLILNLPEWNQPKDISRLAAVFRWLSEHFDWLLILDNADTPETATEVEKTLPQLQSGEVIITSRIADWSTAVQPVELDMLAEEDAAAFLLERTESRRKKMLTDNEDAAAVAHDLGGLALALEQGGAYIAKMRVSFLEYRGRWESRKEEVLAWHDERLMQYPFHPNAPMKAGHPRRLGYNVAQLGG